MSLVERVAEWPKQWLQEALHRGLRNADRVLPFPHNSDVRPESPNRPSVDGIYPPG